MNIEKAKELSYDAIRSLYKEHLMQQGVNRNTTTTTVSDTFYLWNNGSHDIFWKVLTSNDFETVATEELRTALTANSNGDVESLISGYVAVLRKFKAFIFDAPEQDHQEESEALKAFLMDIDCLNPLSEWTSKFNLFDVLKITRTEIRHSNMLSWLLSPNENHGLGDSIIRGFLQYEISTFAESDDVFDILLMDCHDFEIQREWHNIDILAVSPKSKFILCIENKIDTGEHDNQLQRYKKLVDETYPDYRKMFIFLSPEGAEASDPENWCSMGYQDVLSIIENARKKVQLISEAEMLIDNYIEAIRRDIVGDEKLAKICTEIYAKHKKALDLIFENKPDTASNLAVVLRAWAIAKHNAGELELVLDKCNKTYTRFKTKAMSDILPDAEDSLSGWNTHNYYFYEIRNEGGTNFFIQLALSSKNIPDDLREVCNRINRVFPSRTQKENWQWRLPFTSKKTKLDEEAELNEEHIYDMLDKKFDEVKAFETKLAEGLQKLKD